MAKDGRCGSAGMLMLLLLHASLLMCGWFVKKDGIKRQGTDDGIEAEQSG